VVVQFDFRGAPQQSYWLLIDRRDVSICLKHPGFEVDVVLTARLMMFYQVWLGRVPLLEAIRKSHVRLEGMPADVQCERLEDYPILDEMDWSEREWDAACEVWEHAGLRERIECCSRAGISIFAARRDELPQDDNGSLRDYLLGH
jgi:hypothetical protein